MKEPETNHQDCTAEPAVADVRRNFACLVWMGSVFAMGWTEVMVVLQPMLVHYGASNTQIGIVQGVLIATLPGMLASPWVTRRFPRKKHLVFVTDTLYLLPLGVVGILVWLDGTLGGWIAPAVMVSLVMWLMMAGQIAAGFGGLPNQEFFTACIPMRLRGRLAGLSAGIGGLLGLAGGGVAAWLLKVMPKPEAYGALLVLAWLLCQLADSAVLLAREPRTPVEKSPAPWGREMWNSFLSDHAFLRVAATVVVISPLMGQLAVFSSVFAFRSLKLDPQMAAWIGMAAAVSRLTLSPAAGWLTDRWGAKPSLLLWAGMSALGFGGLAVFPHAASVFVAAGIAAVAGSGFSGAMNALTSGLPAPEHRAGHFTLLGFGMIGANSLLPLLVGMMFDRVSYPAGFAILGGLSTLVLVGARALLAPISSRAEDFR